MAREFIRKIRPYVKLYRDSANGIAWVEDGSTGLGHSCHPNIDITGSVEGMKQAGYWAKSDIVIRLNGFQYNISRLAIDKEDELDLIAANECRCQECIKRKKFAS